MRGVETRIQEIRHRIFREVARMAYHTEWPVDKRIEELPYKIIPGEIGNYRSDVFLERAIVGERLRLAMGLPYRSAADPAPISDNIEAADQLETVSYTHLVPWQATLKSMGRLSTKAGPWRGCAAALALAGRQPLPLGTVTMIWK